MAVAGSLFVRIGARTKQFNRKMLGVEYQLRKFNGQGQRIASTIRNSMASILPAISPIGAAAAGAGGAILSSFGAASVGIAGFGAASISVLNDVFAAVKEGGDAFNNLSKHQRKAATALQEFQSYWSKFSKAFEKPVTQAFSSGLNILTYALQALKPAFLDVANVVNGLMESMRTAMEADDMVAWFAWMRSFAGPAVESLGKSFGYLMRGIMNLMVAFGPLAEEFNGGFLSMMKSFSQWAAALQNSTAFQQFINYVRNNGPTVLSLIGNLVSTVIAVGTAMAPLGSIVLKVVNGFMSMVQWLLQLNPYLTYIAVGIAIVKASISGLTAVIGLLSSPVWAVIAAISVLSTVFMYLFKNNQQFRTIVLQVWQQVKTFIMTSITQLVTWFQTYWPLIQQIAIQTFQRIRAFVMPIVMAIVNFVMQQFAAFQSWWNQHGAMITQAAQKTWSFIKSFISGTLKFLQGLFKVVFPILKSIVLGVWNGIKNIIAGALGFIRGLIQAFAAAVTGNWKAFFQATRTMFSSALQFIWGLVNTFLIGRVLGLVRIFGRGFMAGVRGAMNTVKNLFRSGLSRIQNFVTSKFTAMRKFIFGLHRTFYKAGKGLIGQMAKGIKNAASRAVDAVKGVASRVRNFLPFSPAKDGPLSDLNKLNFGGPILDSIKKGIPKVQGAMQHLVQLPAVSAAGGSGGGYVDNSNVEITIQYQGGSGNTKEEVMEMMDEIDRELERRKQIRARAKGVIIS